MLRCELTHSCHFATFWRSFAAGGLRDARRSIRHRRNQLHRQLLPGLHAPLIERVDAPEDTLGQHFVLTERDQLTECRGRLPWCTLWGISPLDLLGRNILPFQVRSDGRGLPRHECLGLRQKGASACNHEENETWGFIEVRSSGNRLWTLHDRRFARGGLVRLTTDLTLGAPRINRPNSTAGMGSWAGGAP